MFILTQVPKIHATTSHDQRERWTGLKNQKKEEKEKRKKQKRKEKRERAVVGAATGDLWGSGWTLGGLASVALAMGVLLRLRRPRALG